MQEADFFFPMGSAAPGGGGMTAGGGPASGGDGGSSGSSGGGGGAQLRYAVGVIPASKLGGVVQAITQMVG